MNCTVKEYPETVKKLNELFINEVIPQYTALIEMAKSIGIVRAELDIPFFIQYSLNVRKAFRQSITNNPELVKRIGLKKCYEQFYELYLNGILAK